MKVSQLIKRIGWVMIRIKGSHRQFKHQKKKGLVTVPGKLSDDVKKGTLGSVLRQAKLK
jgi:predicted RNA binding protein YcfA (HicA-like mRNA interferase family)